MSIEHARRLRKSLTPQEAKLWTRLRELRPLGFHPRRQMPVGRFIVDFAFRKQRLLIEIDGGHHGGDADRTRDRQLQDAGYRVLRFWNSDVDQNIEGVQEVIFAELQRSAAKV